MQLPPKMPDYKALTERFQILLYTLSASAKICMPVLWEGDTLD